MAAIASRRLGDPARRQGQRIAPGQNHFPDRRARAHIVERRGERLRAEPTGAGPDTLAAEAEAAIDGADRDELDQHPVGIAVDEPLDRTLRVVADRIVALGRIALKLAPVGDELARDRVAWVVRVDQPEQRRRQADGVARGDRLEFGEPLGRGEAGAEQRLRGRQAAGRLARVVARSRDGEPGFRRRVHESRHERGSW